MNEMVIEQLVQSAAAVMKENVELNVLTRNSLAVNETIHAINARIDSILGVSQQLEKGVQLDESRLRQLEEQSVIIKEGLSTFKATAEELNTTVQRLEGKVNQLDKSVQDLDRKIDLWLDGLNRDRLQNQMQWAQASSVINRLMLRLTVTWIIYVLSVAVLVGIFFVLKFH